MMMPIPEQQRMCICVWYGLNGFMFPRQFELDFTEMIDHCIRDDIVGGILVCCFGWLGTLGFLRVSGLSDGS